MEEDSEARSEAREVIMVLHTEAREDSEGHLPWDITEASAARGIMGNMEALGAPEEARNSPAMGMALWDTTEGLAARGIMEAPEEALVEAPEAPASAKASTKCPKTTGSEVQIIRKLRKILEIRGSLESSEARECLRHHLEVLWDRLTGSAMEAPAPEGTLDMADSMVGPKARDSPAVGGPMEVEARDLMSPEEASETMADSLVDAEVAVGIMGAPEKIEAKKETT